MEKEIIKQIADLLAQFNNQQLLILIIAFLLFTIIAILQTVYTSRLIEKYRNQLKKAELKFSVFNEMQITKLSEFYTLTKELKGALAILFGVLERNQNKIELVKWESSYTLFDDFYTSNKYIIPRTIKELMDTNKNLLIRYNVNISLLKEKLELVNNRIHDISMEDKLKSLELIDNEILEFDFKKMTIELMILAESIKVHIEEYFDKIE
jgi:hypothetical protein